MAFRLPTQAPTRRQTSYSRPVHPSALVIPSQVPQEQDDDYKEWVLFSPSQVPSTTHTRTDSTERTARTAGLSRLSDFGSLHAPTQSEHAGDDSDEALEEDQTELDSLDDGLHAFRDANLPESSHPVLPTHDGLGSFDASGQLVQDQLWLHEQYNPHRQENVTYRRRSSVQRHLETVEKCEADDADRERWQRIEKWRMEQSKILLQEVERETKRRQRRNSRASLASTRRSGTDMLDSISETKAMDTLTSSSTETSSTQGDVDSEESFWRRITRKVIRDLIGIDDSLLSVILGESLVEARDTAALTPEESKPLANVKPEEMDREMKDVKNVPADSDMLQERLLQRIARELGILVHQIWEHPSAFSTYLKSGDNPADFYAGIPISRSDTQARPTTPVQLTGSNSLSLILLPHFTPTLRDPVTAEHAAQWGIEEHNIALDVSLTGESPVTGKNVTAELLSGSAHLQQDHEYWERKLDVMMVFRYLRNRFGRGEKDNTSASGHRTTSLSTDQDTSRRAAVIRQHHPLVARAHARQAQFQRQLQMRSQTHSAVPSPSSPISRHRFRRPSSSCASHSTKVSTKRTLPGVGSGSSRHYWDIGGSVGSGSAVVSVGGPAGVGTWGEI